MANKLVGTKIYRFDENDELDLWRIEKYKEATKLYRIKHTNGDTKFIREEDIEEYVTLVPDGLLNLNIVEFDGIKDVIVTLHRKEDSYSLKPYVICRQAVIDVFSMALAKKKGDSYVGLSMSVDTCPPEFPFIRLLDNEKILHTTGVAIYNDDDLNSILGCIHTKKFDDTLINLYNKRTELLQSNSYGWTKSLKELLTDNDFMHDFHKAFHIEEVPFSLKYEDTLPKNALRKLIGELTNDVASTIYVSPYDKTVNLNPIVKPYMLMTADKNSKEDDKGVYVVAYDVAPDIKYADVAHGNGTPGSGKQGIEDKLKSMGFD